MSSSNEAVLETAESGPPITGSPVAIPSHRWYHTAVARYSLAVVAVLLAWAARAALDPVLGGIQPFSLFYVPVILAGWALGLGPAILAAALGWFIGDYFFLPPKFTLLSGGSKEIIASFLYLGISTSLILILHQMRQARRAAELSKWELLTAFHHAPVGIFRVDTNNRITAANQRAADLLGYTPETFVGMNVHDLTYPDDRELSDRVNRDFRERRSARIDYEKRYLKRDGSPIWVRVTVSDVRDPNGRVIGRFGTFDDITLHKRAEKTLRHSLEDQRRALEGLQESETRLRLAVETAELGTYERDLLTKHILLNQACHAILGVGSDIPPHDIAARSVHPDDKERILAAVARAFDPALREICAGEFRILRPDGTMRWVAGRGRVLFDDSTTPPRPVRFIGVLNDITERKRLQAELQHYAESLERTVQDRTAKLRETVAELEGFSYSLVHDMRAPLRAMLGYAGMLETGTGPRLQPAESSLLRKITVAAQRMDQLITDSLNYSRILREDLPLGPVDLGALLRGLVETYPNLHPPQADVSLEIGELPVWGNEAALTQIFSNLLGNAAKFVSRGVHPRVRVWAEICAAGQQDGSPRASGRPLPTDKGDLALNISRHSPRSLPENSTAPRVATSASNSQSPAGSVRVFIQDNGIGIPTDQHEKIFGMFHRLHRAEEYAGTGIGLALVKKSLERIGGDICLESETGKGSRFCVILPRSGERVATTHSLTA